MGKKPPNPYFLFLEDKKVEFVKKAGGDYKRGISMVSKAYKELPSSEKQTYETKAKELKEQYETELKKFLDAGGVKKQIKRKHKSSDEESPQNKRRQKEAEAAGA